MEREVIAIAFFKQMFNSARWEDRFGAIQGSLAFIQQQGTKSATILEYMWSYIIRDRFTKLLVDDEFRVRNQTAALLKIVVASDQAGRGLAHFDELKDKLLENIQQTFKRDISGDASTGALKDKSIRPLIKPDQDSGKTMHDTEGWKSLETSMRNLQHLIEAIGTHLYAFELSQILEVIEKANAHLNRFVREIAYFVINAIFETSVGVQKTEHYPNFVSFCEKLVPLIQSGLSDNWSQVRYASSLCCRSFYAAVADDNTLQELYNGMLVPRMCLNRYYVAEGVRVYSNDTWKHVFGEKGKTMVCQYAD